MSVSISPSEFFAEVSAEASGATPLVPSFVRAVGGVRMRFAGTVRGTALVGRAESGGYRVRTPRTEGVPEAVLINTGGGMAGGDRAALSADLEAGAEALVTTQAAEKIYRSQGPSAEIGVRLSLGPGSRLHWLPQETILFSGSRLARTLDVDMAADAAFLLAESVVFGRLASGETMREGRLHDRWRIRRGGQLVFAEDVRLEGPIADILDRPAAGKGARAIATVLYVAEDALARLDATRETLSRAACECGASAWNGLLVVRFASPDPSALRRDLINCLENLRGAKMPRSW